MPLMSWGHSHYWAGAGGGGGGGYEGGGFPTWQMIVLRPVQWLWLWFLR